jgi:hypothetical protein
MANGARKPIPSATELLVLDRSRRRCALCFYIDGDLTEKKGQLAHLDQNPANRLVGNLAWLCLDHHSEYDSRTSQHKNYTKAEARKARDDLYQAIDAGRHLQSSYVPSAGRAADKKTLGEIVGIFESDDIEFFRTHDFSNSFENARMDRLFILAGRQSGAQHEFLDPELEAIRRQLLTHARKFSQELGFDTFVQDHNLTRSRVNTDWRNHDAVAFYKMTTGINDAASEFCQSFDVLIRAARLKLED